MTRLPLLLLGLVLAAGCAAPRADLPAVPPPGDWMVAADDGNPADDDDPGAVVRQRHNPRVYSGFTTIEGDRGLTFGAEYEFRIGKRLGALAFLERALGDLDSTIYGVTAAWHFNENLFAIGGFGFGDDSGRDFLTRFGARYKIPVEKKLYIMPFVNLDFIEGGKTGFSFGALLGWDF